MSRFFIPSIILFFHLIGSSASGSGVSVHIMSHVPNDPTPLRAHCQSKDDDFGMHTIYNGKEFYWKFNNNFLFTTLYWCDFHWGSKQRSMAVYDRRLYDICTGGGLFFLNLPYDCFWDVRPDGFFLKGNKNEYTKVNSWEWTPIWWEMMHHSHHFMFDLVVT